LWHVIDASQELLDSTASIVAGAHDWNSLRTTSDSPIVIGAVFWVFCESAARAVPHKSEEILKVPEKGKVKMLVIGVTGIAVYEVSPQMLTGDITSH